MCIWEQGGRKLFLAVYIIVCGAGAVQGASGTWLGTENDQWTNSLNWSGSSYPGGNDTATFDNAGNGKTTLQQRHGNLNFNTINFKTANCAAYTLGGTSPNGQRHNIANNGTIKIYPDVVNDQTFNNFLQLGNDWAAASFKIINDSTSATLTLAGELRIYFSAQGRPTGTKEIDFEGVGDISALGNIQTNQGSPILIYNKGSGLLTLSGTNRINQLNMANFGSSDPSRITIGNGSLFLDNEDNSWSLMSYSDGVIDGTGTIRLGTGTGENFAKCYVSPTKTLIVNPKIISDGGLNLNYGSGTLVLNGINDLASNIVISAGGTISVAKIGNRGSSDSNLGQGQRIRFDGNGSGLRYTGSGETSDRILEINNNAMLDQSGSGDLTFAEDLLIGAGNKTLTLAGSSDGAGEITGVIGPGADTTSLAKDGSGLWRLTAANTYAGATTVRNGTLALSGADGAITAASAINLEGGVLRLENNADSNNVNRLNDTIPLALNGGALEFAHSGDAIDYSESVGALTVGEHDSTVSTAQADENYTSTLSFASLARTGRGTLNFTGAGLGTDSNRILFTTPPPLINGYIGVWATVNGNALAMYDTTLGVIPAPASAYTNIAARGPDSMIPDDATLNVRITTAGTTDAIALEDGAGSSVYTLTQLSDTPAVVATAGKTLSTFSVMIAPDAAALAIGENAGDGTLQTGAGDCELLLVNLSTNTLTVNAALNDNSGATTLNKTGLGALTFNGRVNVTGEMVIQEGTLTFGNFASQTHQLGSMVVSGGAQTPTILNLEGPTEIVNFGNIDHASISGDRCIMNISSDLTTQGTERENGKFIVGSENNTAGVVIQRAGAISVSSGRSGSAFLTIGNSGGYGYYRMTGGSCTSGEIAVSGPGLSSVGSVSSVGVFDLFDGELTLDRWCLLISWARGIGALNLFGGSFSGIDAGGEVILNYSGGYSSTSQLNLLGPEARMLDRGAATKKIINLSRGSGNTLGAVNLNNGELTLYRAFADTSSTPTHFNFNGGLLIAAANSAELMQGLTAAHVFPGGARIDTAGYAVTINQSLVAPTGYGVSDIEFVSGGAGYIGAPGVQITGGNGVGATAIALVDLEAESPTCGQVTNILITSAGSGYRASNTLVATLIGGGCLTPAEAGAVTLSASASGGLTKLGAGTLTLGGAGTYSGTTIVSNGTLLVNGSHTGGGGYTCASGTTLGGTGTVALASGTVDLQPGATLAVDDPAAAAEDRLTVSSLTLSDNLVAVAQIDSLDKKERYPILTCTGAITGKLATQIADSSWGVTRIGETFYLCYNSGTLIIIR